MLLAILGRQPKLSLAELNSLLGRKVRLLNPTVALIDQANFSLSRLGGTLKQGRVLSELPARNWSKIGELLLNDDALSNYLGQKKGKLTLGLSVYGLTVSPNALLRLGLELKTRWRQHGRSVRLVAPSGQATNSAQVEHNQLIQKGADVLITVGPDRTWVGVTEQIQDIAAYSLRDYGRPVRSARIGMLPPKLAQIMINLANPSEKGLILDPFCGTGVVLQEAVLMGFKAAGSDINPEMVEASHRNLDWLRQEYPEAGLKTISLSQADATGYHWLEPIDAVVTEGYLGPPQSTEPTVLQLASLRSASEQLSLKFLANLAPQLKSGTPVCMTFPAWRQGRSYERLNIVDRILALGYTMKQFLPVQQADLLYYRADQIVAREIVTLIRTS